MSENNFLQFLRAFGFEPRPDLSSQGGPMGNRIDAYASASLQIRKVIDRGQRFLDLRRNDQSEWRDVFVAIREVDPNFSPKTGSFDEAIKALTNAYSKLTAP